MAQGTAPLTDVFRNNLLVRIRAGGNFARATFTRADTTTCATRIKHDGTIETVAAGVLRTEWVDLDGDGIRETPGILLEGSRQNLALRSEELANAAWTNTSVTISTDADVAPDGTTTGERLTETAANSEHMVSQQVTATADVRHAFSVFAKAGTRNWVCLTIRDVVGGTNRVQAWFNLTTGAIGTVSNVLAGTSAAAFIVKLGNGWYRCILTGACNNADTTPIGTVQVANADGSLFYVGDGVSYISAWGAQFENNVAFPSSYIKTVASAVTRAADSLTLPFNFGPLDTTIYAKIARPVWADAAGTTALTYIAVLGNTVPSIRLYGVDTSRIMQADIQTVPVVNSFSSKAIPAGTSISLSAQYANLTTGGRVTLEGASQGNAAAAFSAYASQTLRVGSNGSGTVELYGVLLDLKVCRGLLTLQQMLAI